mmetsp:Transcript_2028/g.13042  ORF Transcript_2028/g.13042 Transcript_2028/m.13042 type:complete len:209 (-) Transcript_2028:889-1515(-)
MGRDEGIDTSKGNRRWRRGTPGEKIAKRPQKDRVSHRPRTVQAWWCGVQAHARRAIPNPSDTRDVARAMDGCQASKRTYRDGGDAAGGTHADWCDVCPRCRPNGSCHVRPDPLGWVPPFNPKTDPIERKVRNRNRSKQTEETDVGSRRFLDWIGPRRTRFISNRVDWMRGEINLRATRMHGVGTNGTNGILPAGWTRRSEHAREDAEG